MSFERRQLTAEERSRFNLSKFHGIIWRPNMDPQYHIHSGGDAIFARLGIDIDAPWNKSYVLCTPGSAYFFVAAASASWANERRDSTDWTVKFIHEYNKNSLGFDRVIFETFLREAFESYCTTERPARKIEFSGWEALQ